MLLSHENLTKTIRDSNLSDLSGPTTLTLLLHVFVAYVKRFGLLGSLHRIKDMVSLICSTVHGCQ